MRLIRKNNIKEKESNGDRKEVEREKSLRK